LDLLSILLVPTLMLASGGSADPGRVEQSLTSATEDSVPIPAARSGHSAIYDPVRRRLIVFGGDGRDDLWALSLGQTPPRWTRLVSTGDRPPGSYAHAAVYDPMRQRMIVFGGVGLDNDLTNEVWALSLSDLKWTKLAAAGVPPSPREWQTAIYDPKRDRMIVHGGWTSPDGILDDVWVLDLSSSPAWSQLPASPSPPGHRFHSAFYDERRDRMIVFSGSGSAEAQSEVWALPFSTGRWTELGTTGSLPPAVPYGRPAIYDAANDRIVVDGGIDRGVWSLSLESLEWWRIASLDAPIPRDGQTVTFDPVHRQLILFGGFTTFDRVEGIDLADTWSFNLDTGTWSEIDSGGPSLGAGHTAVGE